MISLNETLPSQKKKKEEKKRKRKRDKKAMAQLRLVGKNRQVNIKNKKKRNLRYINHKEIT